MTVALDYGAYPHLLEAVVAFADRGALLALRPVSQHVRALAEARLFHHVAVVLDPTHDPALVILVEPQSPHRRLPFLVPKLHRTLMRITCGTTWEATVRALRIVDVHVPPDNEALRHLISLIPIHAPRFADAEADAGSDNAAEGVRLMRRHELGGLCDAEDVLTKLQAPSAVAYLDFRAKWPPQMTITSPLMRRVTVHVSLDALRDPWVIRPRDAHGCREAFIVLDPHGSHLPPALSVAIPQYVYQLVKHFFTGAGGAPGPPPSGEGGDGPNTPTTVVTVVGLERFRSDVPRAMREIRAAIGRDGEVRLEKHLVAVRYSEWRKRTGEDAALEQQPELTPIMVSPSFMHSADCRLAHPPWDSANHGEAATSCLRAASLSDGIKGSPAHQSRPQFDMTCALLIN